MLNLKRFYVRWQFILRNYWYWEKPDILSRLTLVLMVLTMIIVALAFAEIYKEFQNSEHWFLSFAIACYCSIKTLDFIGDFTKKFIESYYDDQAKKFAKDKENYKKWRDILLGELDLPMNASTNQIRERLNTMSTEEQIKFYNRMIDLNRELDMFWLPQEKIEIKKEEKK